MHRRLPAAWGIPAVWCLLASPAEAQTVDPGAVGAGPIGGSWSLEGGVFGSLALGLGITGFALPQNRRGGANTPRSYNQQADLWSNVTGGVGGTLIAGMFATGMELTNWAPGHSAGAPLLGTLVVLTESAALSSTVNLILKKVVGRCRPFAYDGSECDPSRVPPQSPEQGARAYHSWPSGHVAPIASVTGAAAGLALKSSLSGKRAWWRWLSAGLGATATVATIHLRVQAGAHSISDTWSSAALSFPIGLATAWVHPLVQTDTAAPHLGFREQILFLEWTL